MMKASEKLKAEAMDLAGKADTIIKEELDEEELAEKTPEAHPGFEMYEHHGEDMIVRSDLKGKHRDHCLCYTCERFKPDTLNNCHKSEEIFQTCVALGVVLPVWECGDYV